MAIKSKYRAEAERQSFKSTDYFTDRHFFKEQFYNAFANNKNDIHNVLVFYGIGGIGKSTLRKEIQRILRDEYKDTISECIDLDLPVYRQEETALYHLRKNLNDKYKIEFNTFDIAYAVYWQKTHPNTPLSKDTLPLLEHSKIIISLLSTIGQIPIIGLIPGIAASVIKGSKIFKEWWIKRGQKELYNLPELEAKDILLRLPMYFASDLKDHLISNNAKCVLMIDTYEALWENIKAEGSFFMKDEWIREMVSEMPELLWLIFGREQLRWNELEKEWNEYIKQYLIGGLSESDSKLLLSKYKIDNEKIQNIIVKASEGVPHYLELAVDQYYQIKNNRNREPEEVDFAGTQQGVLDRFLRYLDKSEIETLKVLSAARKWDSDIFALLVDRFKTGYPITALSSLTRFSFIMHDKQNNLYTINSLMKEGLRERIEVNIRKKIHECLFEYFNNRLKDADFKNITFRVASDIDDAFYHASKFMNAKELAAWFYPRLNFFTTAGKWKEMIPMMEEVVNMTEKESGESKELAESLNKLAELYINTVKYKEAEELLENAISLYDKTGNTEQISVLLNLAVISSRTGKYDKAGGIYDKCLNICKKRNDEKSVEYGQILNNFAILKCMLGNYNEAAELFTKALAVRKECHGKEHIEYAKTLNNLGIAYKHLRKFDEAQKLYDEVLSICRKAFNEEHPLYLIAQSNVAIICNSQRKFDKAIVIGTEIALALEKIYGKVHPEYSNVLSNLAASYYNTGDYEKAIELHKQDISVLEQLYGTGHPFYSEALLNMADSYLKLKEFDKCTSIFNEVTDKYLKQIKSDDEIYLNYLAFRVKLSKEMKEYNKALESCSEIMKITETSEYKMTDNEVTNDIIFIYEQLGMKDEAENIRKLQIKIKMEQQQI